MRNIEPTTDTLPSRTALVNRHLRNRNRSRMLFDLIADQAYYSQPVSIRHPIVFYEGHIPAFSFNTLVKKALGGRSVDERLETLFARGIDPHGSANIRERTVNHASQWPSRSVVRDFMDETDRHVLDALMNAEFPRPGHPLLDRAEAVWAILEHEAMHHETLLYLLHRLPFEQKKRPPDYRPRTRGPVPPVEWIDIPGGEATLGVDRDSILYGWDNEFPAWSVQVPSFEIERHDVTNARFLEFVEAGGYRDARWWTPDNWRWVQEERIAHPLFWERRDDAWSWRGMFERIPMPLSFPVYVSFAEASAYARWRGARLPTEAEFQRAAYGSSRGEIQYPWGSSPPSPRAGVFDFASWDPHPAGGHPEGASSWGVEDLVGNGWEWTCTPFAPFPGFRAMASYPEYSADFFDGEHYVLKGASPATARELLRPTFRNWFRERYPYVYATFRCAKTGSGRP